MMSSPFEREAGGRMFAGLAAVKPTVISALKCSPIGSAPSEFSPDGISIDKKSGRSLLRSKDPRPKV